MTVHPYPLDHVLIATSALGDAEARMRRLGFCVTPRGFHRGWGTANHCVMFEQDYLELLGIVDPSGFCNGLDLVLSERGEGLLGLSFAASDVIATRDLLRSRGVAVQEVQHLQRALALPEGEVMLEFSLLRPLDAAALPAVNGFFVQHRTPELLRKPEWLAHPNTAKAVSSVTVALKEPRAIAQAYEKIFSRAAVVFTDETVSVHVGPQQVLLFVRPDDAASLYPDLGDLPKLPALVAMTLRVADLKAARAVLNANHVEHRALSYGTLRVAPPNAGGFALDFSQAASSLPL